MPSEGTAQGFDVSGQELGAQYVGDLIRPYRGRIIEDANFEGATFNGAVDFAEVAFGRARFSAATFNGHVNFEGAQFHEEARFDSVTFEHTASFRAARFHADAIFEYTDSSKSAGLAGRREVVVFRRWADFSHARFAGDARFGGVQFEDRAMLGGASFEANLSLEGATFSGARTLGPINVGGWLNLDRATFEAPVRMLLTAGELTCEGTQFLGRTAVEVSARSISLEDAEFAQPSTIAGRSNEAEKVRLTSLRRANLANVTLANFDLEQCSMLGTHNLDRVRIEESDFPGATGRWATRRQMVSDEHDLRKGEPRVGLSAERVAEAYRSLRKGREDNKDEPGAADFYYGEMEMRRRASTGFERAILTLYWLISGYGLRASRAVAALAVTVVVFAAGFSALSGFDPPQGFWKSLLFSAESTSSLFRAPSPPNGAELNDEGHVMQMALRLLGPLFIGLALLALRARVKR
jgi:uncharacterized protein YjbI with pentapeptide repeats